MARCNAESGVAQGFGLGRFVTILAFAAGSVLGPTCPAQSPTVPTLADQALRQRVADGYNRGILVGMVNRDGRTLRGYGRRSDLSDAVPDGQTLFEIGSITKLFTAALLADAVVRGEVGLDDPVQSLLPDAVRVPRGTQEILLRHLATHRSGLPSTPDNLCSTRIREPFACYDEARLHDFLGRYLLTREPGASWEYSNLGFGLLGHALALRAGHTYEGLLRERILSPLGLTSTVVAPTAEPLGNLASGSSGALSVPPIQMPALEGAGVLRSTADDLLTFLEFHLGLREGPLSEALRDTQQLQGPTAYPGISIGLGWLQVALPGGQVLQHDGETPGFSAFIGFQPDKGLGVVILSNSRVNARSRIADVGFHLLDSSYPLTSVPHPASVPDAILGKYPGVYRAEDGDRFELGIHGKRLVLYHVRSDFEFTLYPRSNTRFDALEIELGENASALFRTDVSGVVTRLDWTQQGRTVAYTRERGPATVQLERDSGDVLISVTGGADAGHHIEVSTDLRQWERIGTVQAGSNALVDPGATSRDIRFYRAARIR